MTAPYFFPLYLAAGILCTVTLPLRAQTTSSTGPGLFDSDEPLHITLNGRINPLLNNRLLSPQKYAATLTLISQAQSESAIPVELTTRGHFRRLNQSCTYPPLLIHFSTAEPQEHSIFREQKKLKLVMPCDGDDYIIREWLVYELYNLLTPQSFRARLVQTTLIDDKTQKKRGPFYGILLEEEKQMAKRNGMLPLERKLNPTQIQKDAFLKMAVFEYLIGNTDWSVQYLQNIKLLIADSTASPIAVPYDFDHSGMVDAPYAKPASALEMRSVRQRRYRGYCVSNLKTFEPVIAQYQQLKSEIYRMFTSCPHLDAKYIKSMVDYLDEFYATMDDPKAWQKAFAYPCNPNGTGHVVIKGLKKD